MADYTELKAAIRAAIFDNTEQAITGESLQEILVQMVDELGESYVLPEGGIPASDLAQAVRDALAEAVSAYQLPVGGIPEADLAQAVRNALAAGLSAYQKPASGIPETDLAQAVRDALAAALSAYQKPQGGIPKTDLSQGVQESLNKADGALTQSDIADNLSTDDPTKVLSAKQGKVLDGKVSQLGQDVDDLNAEINGETGEVTTEYNEAGYIRLSDGAIVTNNTWIHTPLFPIETVTSFGKIVGHSSVAAIAFFSGDDQSSYISGIIGSNGGGIPVDRMVSMSEVTIPETAKYVAFSTDGATYPKLTVVHTQTTGGIKEKVDELDTDINGSTEETTVEYTNAGYIKYDDGTIVSGGTWVYSDMLPIETVKKFGKFVAHGSVANVAFYSANSRASYISGIKANVGVASGEIVSIDDITIPEGARYISFSTNGADYPLTVTMSIVTPGLIDRVDAMEEQIDAEAAAIAKMRRVGVSPRMLHFSFDDTISALYDIAHNNRASIFDNAFFAALKRLHDTYQCVFSCYCFLDYIDVKFVSAISTITTPSTTTVYHLGAQDGNYAPGDYVYRNGEWTAFTSELRPDYLIFSLSSFPASYAAEFADNSDWLKFGFHGLDGLTSLAGATAEDAESKYNSFITSVLTIAGTPAIVDTVVRFQNFSGTLAACQACRDADLGVQGLLCADYSEMSGGSGGQNVGYYLSAPAPTIVWKKGQYYDNVERLHFYMSALRMDATPSANMPAYMANFLTANRWEQTAMLEMYCHENQMYNVANNTISADYETRMAVVCAWAVENGFTFGYQMDRIRSAF